MIYKKFRFHRQVALELTAGIQDHIEWRPQLARLSQNVVEKLAPIHKKISLESDEWKLIAIDKFSIFLR